MPKPEDYGPNDVIPGQPYEEDLHCRPVGENGTWFAIVRIKATRDATVSEVRADILDSLEIDFAEGHEHCLESAEVLVGEQFGLYPDNGSPDGPVIDFP